MADVTLWHPKLQETVTVHERAAAVYKKSGWTTSIPKDKQPDEKKEA